MIKVEKNNAEQAIEALVLAFQDYALFTYFYPDQEERRKALSYMMASAVYYGRKYGEVYTTSEDCEGTAIWVPSENCPLTFWRALRSVPPRTIWGLATNMTAQMKEPNDYIDSTHLRLAPFRHIYLQSIGINPACQGQGFSGKLIRPMLNRFDEEGMPCYLETLDEKNVSIYEHLGFKLIERSTIPGTTLENFAMLRDPAK